MKLEPFNEARGKCYHSSLALGELYTEHGMDVMVCHGIATNAKSGERMGHGWLELFVGFPGGRTEVMCIDGIYPNVLVPRRKYYELGHVADVVRYTVLEAQSLYAKHDYPGPHDPKIQAAAHVGDE